MIGLAIMKKFIPKNMATLLGGWFCKTIFMLGILFRTVSLYAQKPEIKGTITDKDGPMPGVNVIEKGTSNGVITDPNGEFSIGVTDESSVLIFSFVGMKTQEIKVDGKRILTIEMIPENDLLEEVAVVGYGIQKKVNLTGSVSTVDFAEQADSRPVTNVSTALSGLAAGVQVMQGSAQPGSDNSTIRIRGTGTLNNSNPLVLVDGFEADMNNVNPSDIESISVLKDAASCAIYGSRGANGVILVNTKKGSKRPTVTYSGIISFQQPSNTIEMVSDYARHMELINEGRDNMSRAHQFSQSSIDAWRYAKDHPDELNEYGVPNSIAYPNTNWFDEIFHTGKLTEHNLSVSGSSEKVKYLFSFGYLNNEGIMDDSGLEKYQFRTNLETDLYSWLTLGTRIYGLSQSKGMANISRGFSYLDKTTPGIYPGSSDKWGVPALQVEESSNANNIFEKMVREGYDKMFRASASIYGIVKVFKGLTFEPSFNYAPEWGDYATWGVPKGTWDYVKDERVTNTDLSVQQIYNSSFKRKKYIMDLLLRYHTVVNGNHKINALIGHNTTYYNQNSFNATVQGMTDWSLHQLSTGTEVLSANGSETDWALISYFGRLNYNFNDRYLFEMNMRADASSRFHPDARVGFFPSFSFGYRISEEPFMEDLKDVFQNLKIRASWGKLGNNSSGNYDWQSYYGNVKQVLGGDPTDGLAIQKIGNSFLEWETTTTSNLGIDMAMCDQRLVTEIELYNKDTEGILFVPAMYATMGTVEGSTQNLAAVRNQGLELNLSWKEKKGDFQYEIGANLAYNVNRVTKYRGAVERGWVDDGTGTLVYQSNVGETVQSGFDGVIAEGHTLGEYYLHTVYNGDGRYPGAGDAGLYEGPSDGMIRNGYQMKWVEKMIDQGYTFVGSNIVSPTGLYLGDLIYNDNNGDGDYGNENDKQFTGKSSLPKFNFGLNLSASYRGLDLSMVWAGSAGFSLYWNQDFYNASRTANGYSISQYYADNHYFYNTADPNDSRTNVDALLPRLTDDTERTNDLASDFWLYDASFLKLRNLQIGYTIPEQLTKKILIQKMRVYVSGENILTLTKFPGMDPEIGADVNYPTMKQFAFGVNVSF